MNNPSDETSRRSFLERLSLGIGATVLAGSVTTDVSATAVQTQAQMASAAFAAGGFGVAQAQDPQVTTIPLPVTTPNILVLMVDQLREPSFWLTLAQAQLLDSLTPNITFLRKNSVVFSNCFVAATACTPSRSALLTGLYTPQTAALLTQVNPSNPEPKLSKYFPTFGSALQAVVPAYQNNVFWYGKWHVSNLGLINNTPGPGYNPDTVPSYGFNTIPNTNPLFPKWPDTYGSPNGTANEGANGVPNPPVIQLAPNCQVPVIEYASDAGIASAFQASWGTSGPPSPWCTVVSFVNPHDMSAFPNAYPYPPNGTPVGMAGDPLDCYGNFSPATQTFGTPVFTSSNYPPNSWNYESQSALAAKNLALQTWFLQYQNGANGVIAGPPAPPPAAPPVSPTYQDFLNWYFFLVSEVDFQIQKVLKTVFPTYSSTQTTPLSLNTAIIFLSDHGDYGGSHGLHSKGGAVYDEAIRVPLYVMLPGQTGSIVRTQMCSLVDFFRLIVELGNGGVNVFSGGAYSDQLSRQSIWNFCYNNTSETRTVMLNLNGVNTTTPYILTTTDEIYPTENPKDIASVLANYPCNLQNHVICLRTKSLSDNSNLPSYYSGAKYAIYSKWELGYGPNIDNVSVPQQVEFYDYTNQSNRSELGNNVGLSGPSGIMQTAMVEALGNGPIYSPSAPATGLIASQLMAPLTGTGLGSLTQAAFQTYNTFIVNTFTGCTQ